MKKISLNGLWQMSGAGMTCEGNVPGSVYSFLLENQLMEDPFYRMNELEALKLLDNEFTFFVVYGSCVHTINYEDIHVMTVESEVMTMEQTNEYIQQNIGRKVVMVGASTGTDAHTVGIDAIMNRKGFAGHYGLERYEMIEAYNLGAQVENEDFVKKAVELNADVLLVSQTVTQKDVHIQNMTELIELLEAEGLRSRFVVICGGARITHELAKELGFDAGFGPRKFAEDVASFAVEEMTRRGWDK